MREIITLLDDHNGAIMVVITFVYVVATILICWANIKSANATKEQLAEAKRQFSEENRPNIEVEFCYERRLWYIVRFVNNGKMTARNVKIDLQQEFIDSLPEPPIKENVEKQRGKECIIGVGQHYDLYIGSNKLRGNPNMRPVTGTVRYESGDNVFTTEIYIDLKNYMTFFSSTSDQEDLLQAIKKNTAELKGIKQATQRLSQTKNANEENL